MFYPKKNLLEKAAAIKRFEYLPLGKEFKKKQTGVAEKQYQGLNKLFKPDEIEESVTIKKEKLSIIGELTLMYDSKYSFSDYKNVRKYCDLSFMTKYDKLITFYYQLNEVWNLVPQTEKTKMRKRTVYKNADVYIIHC